MELSPARRDGVMEAMKRYSSMVYRLAYARTRNHKLKLLQPQQGKFEPKVVSHNKTAVL